MTARTDVLLLSNAIMGQFLSGFATRIFIISLPTIASALHADTVSGATAAPWRAASGAADVPYPYRCCSQATVPARTGCTTVTAGS